MTEVALMGRRERKGVGAAAAAAGEPDAVAEGEGETDGRGGRVEDGEKVAKGEGVKVEDSDAPPKLKEGVPKKALALAVALLLAHTLKLPLKAVRVGVGERGVGGKKDTEGDQGVLVGVYVDRGWDEEGEGVLERLPPCASTLGFLGVGVERKGEEVPPSPTTAVTVGVEVNGVGGRVMIGVRVPLGKPGVSVLKGDTLPLGVLVRETPTPKSPGLGVVPEVPPVVDGVGVDTPTLNPLISSNEALGLRLGVAPLVKVATPFVGVESETRDEVGVLVLPPPFPPDMAWVVGEVEGVRRRGVGVPPLPIEELDEEVGVVKASSDAEAKEDKVVEGLGE